MSPEGSNPSVVCAQITPCMFCQAVLDPAQSAAFMAALSIRKAMGKRGENGGNVTHFHGKTRTLVIGQCSISTLSCSSLIQIFISQEGILAAPMFPSSMLVCRKEDKIPVAGEREGTGTCAGFSSAPSW